MSVRRRAGKSKNPKTIAEHFASMTGEAIRFGDGKGYSRLVDGALWSSFTHVITRRGTYYIFHDRSWLWVQTRLWKPSESITPPVADTQPCRIGGTECICSQWCKRAAVRRKSQRASRSSRSATSQSATTASVTTPLGGSRTTTR